MTTKEATIEIEVVRSFFYKGATVAPKTVLEVPERFGLHVIDCGKARRRVKARLETGPPAPETAQAPEAETPEARGRRRAGAMRSAEG